MFGHGDKGVYSYYEVYISLPQMDQQTTKIMTGRSVLQSPQTETMVEFHHRYAPKNACGTRTGARMVFKRGDPGPTLTVS
jgi:hypothetical protein